MTDEKPLAETTAHPGKTTKGDTVTYKNGVTWTVTGENGHGVPVMEVQPPAELFQYQIPPTDALKPKPRSGTFAKDIPPKTGRSLDPAE